ncbi:hypothetical protein, partial [Klebsiella pneumoniae]|uniref:hypothetical protein n=1 Tax=Klebsiella pneumoniae TaxID=573 RepID=UPI003135FA98
MEVAGIALHAVQLADQVARQLRALGARRADHDAVGAWVGEHHGLLALLGAAAAWLSSSSETVLAMSTAIPFW